MPLAVYIKAPPQSLRQNHKKKERAFYGLLVFIGSCSIVFAAWPFLAWQSSVKAKFTPVEKFPIPQSQVLSAGQNLPYSDIEVVEENGFSYFSTNFKPEGPRPQEFHLTIPRLKIENAAVKVDSLDFKTNLSHFPGSPLPGDVGNSFITGHSVLPQFADPTNYRTIFTKLNSLEVGDEVVAQINGQTHKYVVQYSKVVSPKDVSVLGPISKNGKNLTLMTCVPPGTSLKRLIVVASLL